MRSLSGNSLQNQKLAARAENHPAARSQNKRGSRLEVEHVSLTYQEGTPFAVPALEDVSLSVHAGERLAIAGPVGSGKSTLLAVLAGVEPPTAGRVIHEGGEVTSRRQPPAGSIGLTFQSPENCLFEKSVLDDVAFAPRRQGLDEREVKNRVIDALSITGMNLEQFGHRSPFSLSTGEQRRVALAGVLAMEPAALLLDEPTAHLDPLTRRELIERLVRLNEATGVTMVMVGHDMDELARFAQRVVIIDGGRLAADGAAADLLTDTVLLAGHSLDPPGTVELCELLEKATSAPVTAVIEEVKALELLLGLIEKRTGGSQLCR
ncbi:MAG: ATP-binding cassette domain-containing protein [Thermoleophilia bacterium]|nr:ATP-binding cassette domain-containing protein [Thermoleophilia bacterium]